MDDIFHSRIFAAVEKLRAIAEDHHRFSDKRVLLTGESAVLGTQNGKDCFIASLQLLMRICSDLTMALPPGEIELETISKDLISTVAIENPVRFMRLPQEFTGFDAILCIGSNANPKLPWTVVNSDGWLARVSSGPSSLPATNLCSNPIGALAAAALGTVEVFKRLINLKPSRGKLVNNLSYNFYTYSVGESSPGPALPNQLETDLLLVGAGAIGNSVVYLLKRLLSAGRMWIVDPQNYGPENWGTCLSVTKADINQAKALVLAREMSSATVVAKEYVENIEEFSNRLGNDIPYPKLILGALDNIDARHQVQHIWPDLVIDGAISDFACQVSHHAWDADEACLICLFRRPDGDKATLAASRATGLSQARVSEMLDEITNVDVQNAPAEKREWLQQRIGRKICSVIEEGIAQQISDSEVKQGFQPSAPFVAALSAVMIVTELVKSLTGEATNLEPRFQFDVLRGPHHGMMVPQGRQTDCLCVSRRNNIERLRRSRAI